jgi:pimeloyl-ACP methyl ester carboxylesterase
MDAAHVSGQLHALLRAANEKGPYILVGHSLGGPYARMFAAQYRNEVVGLVLVDATHPSQIATHAEVGLPSPDQVSPVVNFLASSGILPMAIKFGIAQTSYDKSWNDLPADIVPAVKALKAGPQPLKTWLKETDSLADTLNQISTLSSLGDLPVTVVSSDKWIDTDAQIAERRADWNKRQQHNWLAISMNSRFLIIPGADHVSLLSNKEHSHAVADAIVKMVVTRRHH